MKIINISKNTIYLPEIDKYFPYLEDEKEQEINIDEAKKSEGFRTLLYAKKLKITNHNGSLFERNLVKIQEIPLKEKEIMKTTIENNGNIEVKIRGHFYEAGGYAKKNRNLAYGLSKLGIIVNIDPVNKSNDLNEIEIRQISSINKPVSNKCISIDSMIPTLSSMSNGKYRILNTTIEAYSVPQQFLDVANQYHEIWVTSDIAKEVLEKQKISRPVYVIPDSIDTKLYNENVEPYEFNPPLRDFVFLSVFGWGYRKGYDVLLKSYLQEFSDSDNVSLLIMSRFIGDGKDKDTVKDTIKKYINEIKPKNTPHIVRYNKVVREEQMPNLYKAAKAFVIFSRGEGTGIPYWEASLCGIPVIATNCSGHSMFLKKDNSTLIDIDDIQPLQTGQMHVHYWDDQLFPVLKSNKVINDSRKAMRYVLENYKESLEKNKKLQNFIKENFDISIVANKANERLKQIWKKIN